MEIRGEMYLCINGLMNFLSLFLAARLGRMRFRPGRAAFSACLLSGYALLALFVPLFTGIPALLMGAFLMALLAFGKQGIRLCPLVFSAGLLFSGLMDWLGRYGWGTGERLLLCAAFSFIPGLIPSLIRGGGVFSLTVKYRGKKMILPAFRDSGNLLRHPLSGLPVIVIAERSMGEMLPDSFRANDLSTLPPTWQLIRVRTAAGERTLMCFHPDELFLAGKGKKQRLSAAVAIADFAEKRALLPDEIFETEEECGNAGF